MKLRVLACLALSAISVFAADVTGKWMATVPSRDGGTREVTYNFKADGEKLTGTMSTPQGEREIENGKLDGDNVSFTMSMGQRKMNYAGKVEGDELKMKMTMEGGEMPAREVVAKRAK